MAQFEFTLDREGVGQILKSEALARAVTAAAAKVSSAAQATTDHPVEMTARTTDRTQVSVTIAHPSGRSMQAKHGTLTRSAAAAGLDVRARK